MAGDARRLVAERGLTAAAVAVLTPLLSEVGFEQLGDVKRLLKHFFSAQEWGEEDDAALAAAVGPGEGGLREEVAPGLLLVAGWTQGSFGLRLEAEDDLDFGATFASGVEPQATPNPRTVRFVTGTRRAGASRSFKRGSADVDPAVATLFAVSPDVVDVLVGTDFVAVSIARPAEWPRLVEPMVAAVADAFDGEASESTPEAAEATHRQSEHQASAPTRLERAWAELGQLRPSQPEDLAKILAAAGADTEPARRQVAASLLGEAPLEEAAKAWSALVHDSSRAVRRAAVDAVVDANDESLRSLLEGALDDVDAWVRWKALHGLVVLGADPSRARIEAMKEDADFRVRLEATNVLAR